MKKSIRSQRRKRTRGKVMISAVFLSLLLVMFVNSMRLQTKHNEYQKKVSNLKTQVEAEKERTEELEEFRKYAKTKKYIEEIARDKLGLVYEDEIIFKAD